VTRLVVLGVAGMLALWLAGVIGGTAPSAMTAAIALGAVSGLSLGAAIDHRRHR
jgi:hypothetical protein